MSYGHAENSQEELDVLVGAKIEAARILAPDEQFLPDDLVPYAFGVVALRLRFRKEVAEAMGAEVGLFHVWQDEEGNGPGYIAYVGEAERSS